MCNNVTPASPLVTLTKGSNKLLEAKAYASARNGVCTSSHYISGKSKLHFRCERGHDFESNFTSMKFQKSWCAACSVIDGKAAWRKKRDWLGELKLVAEQKGGQCTSKEYLNSKTKLTFACNKGHTWEASPSSVKNGSWCPYCSRFKVEDALGELQAIARSKGGECLSSEYERSHIKLKFVCADGHEWEARPNDIRKGTWCPTCVNKTEALVRQFFECVYKQPFPGTRLPWLVDEAGKQRVLDGYNDKLKIAFEYHGAQHFEHIKFFHENSSKRKTLKAQKTRDAFVRETCRANNVLLVEISSLADEYTKDEFIEHVKSAIEKATGFFVSQAAVDVFNEMPFQVSKLKVLQNLAQEKGGKLLSTKYLGTNKKLKWSCKDGHEWETIPKSVQNGHWCPFCSKCRRVDPLSEARIIAKSKGAELLTTTYKNQDSRLEFVCSKGHTFNLSAGSLFNNGNWCAICAGNRLADPLEALHEHARNKGGICLTTHYTNSNMRVEFRCKDGHEWHAAASQIRHSKSWCPECNLKRLRNLNHVRSLKAKEKRNNAVFN